MRNITPAISVLMSAYNSESYLAEAIDSVLNQTFTDFEFIIYEDCSTDNTLSVLQSYAVQDKRIKLIVNSENKGLTANLIEGVNSANGKYLARMDADDVCMPDRLQKQFDYLEMHQEISLLGTSVIFFDDNGSEFVGYQPLEHDEIKVELLIGYTMLHPSVMMRLNDFRKHNLNYDINFRYSQDFDLWVRAVALLKFANIKVPLIKMREHENKISREFKPRQMVFSDKIRKFQLDELMLNLDEDEIRIFNILGSSYLLKSVKDLKKMHELSKKIIIKNKIQNKYNCRILKNALIKIQKEQYHSLLKNKNRIGLFYWRSRLLSFTLLNFKFNLRILFRTINLLTNE